MFGKQPASDSGGMYPEDRKEPPPLQYAGAGPVHFVLPVSQSFVPSAHKNIVISTSLPGASQSHSKNILRPMFASQFGSLNSPLPHSSSPVPSSQIVYKEMVQEVSGKKFVSAIPVVKGPEERPSPAPVMYPNLMVFNPYGGSSRPPPLYQHPHADSADSNRCYTDTSLDTSVLKTNCSKTPTSRISELSDQPNSRSSLLQSQDLQSVSNSMDALQSEDILQSEKSHVDEEIIHDSEMTLDQGDSNTDMSSKRVKILSNVKVELPIQHIPDIIDLTSSSDMQQKRACSDVMEPNLNTEEALLPDFVDAELCQSYSQNKFRTRSNFSTPSGASSPSTREAHPVQEPVGAIVNTFSVIKNIGNPNVYKDSYQVSEENKSEECIIPDLTCNEKPSISPCSELTSDSSEEVYERLCALADTAGSSAKLPTDLHYPVLARGSRKNIFVKKTKKILSIKSLKSSVINLDNPSSSKTFSMDISKSYTEESPNKSPVQEGNRLDGFFKELDKQKNNSSSVSFEKSTSRSDCEDSRSCSLDVKDHSMDTDAECIVGTYGNDFRNCISDKVNGTHASNGEDCPSGVERLIIERDNMSQNNFTELETVRPVNVIAFGSIASPASPPPPSESSASTFVDVEKTSLDFSSPSKEKRSLDNLIRESYNAYTEYFSAHKNYGDEPSNNFQKKIEDCAADEEEEKKVEYINWDVPQKEEYGFQNFIECGYSQGLYQKMEDPKNRKVSERVEPRSPFSQEEERNNYAELLCPREDNFSEQEHKGSFLDSIGTGAGGVTEITALNIRTDERMPPRGELSEQESSGDTPWPGMYCDVVGGSTSYDLLARESWPSDGSDMEMPVSPAKNAYNEQEDMPIVVGVKPPDRNYRCASCGKGFNCPKERRVHRSKEHPPQGAPGPPKKVIKKRRNLLLKTTNIKIKNEKYVKLEPISTSTKVEETIQDVDLLPVKIGDTELLDEKKPKIELVKEETKKKKRDYLCATCKLEFTTEPAFNFHLKIHPLECLTCGKFFHKRANLQLHVKRHLGIKNYRCDVCEKRFVTKQKLLEHYNTHTGLAPVKCSLCDETFRRHSNMVQHRNRHHFHLKRRLRDYVCHCGEIFHSKKKLAWHKEIHDERPKACLHCSEKFVHVASLTRHMRRAHNSYYIPDVARQKENVTCPICQHVYLKSSIDMHLRTHSGSKPYSCVICNKNFTTKWNLKLHRWTHANRSSKPFKCSLCKGAFVRHTDYISHMNSHKAVRPYTCNYCGCQFIRKYNCQRHVKEHENVKKYACEVPDCGKTFHRSYYLSEHMSVHSGLRPFSCNICGKTSSTKSNHNKHLKIHHAREPVTTEG